MGLFKPWMSKNGARAEKAVAKLNDQKKLTEAALKAPLEGTRIAAVERQRDQSVIARVIAMDKSETVRICALKRCTDDSFLARLARDTGYGTLALTAVEQIRSEPTLAQVACEAKDERLAYAAADRIRSEQILAQVARSANNRDVCRVVVERIDDETLLLKVADGMSEYGACEALKKIAQFPDAEKQLRQLMASAKNHQIREYARIRLGKISSDPNTLLACARQSNWLDSKLIEKIDDLALLEKTMLEDSDETCRWSIATYAIKRLSDAALLSFALRADNSRYIRSEVAVELMKRDASRHARPLAPLLDECLRDDRVYLLAELGDPRAVAPLEELALSEHRHKMIAPQALGRIHTKGAVAALLRIMGKDQVAAQYAQQALMKLYREAKDDMVRDAIAAIPRRVYHEHYDIGDQGRSCHGDQPYVHFDLIV